MTPSFISALQTYMNIDWRYVAGKCDICNILNKQRMRMFVTWLNKVERKEYIKYNSEILFWNNLYNININDPKTIKRTLGTIDINKKLYRPRFYNMDFYLTAQPIDLSNPYNENIGELRIVSNYNDFKLYLKNKYNSLDLSELKLEKYKVIDPIKGRIIPFKDNIIELVYNFAKGKID